MYSTKIHKTQIEKESSDAIQMNGPIHLAFITLWMNDLMDNVNSTIEAIEEKKTQLIIIATHKRSTLIQLEQFFHLFSTHN